MYTKLKKIKFFKTSLYFPELLFVTYKQVISDIFQNNFSIKTAQVQTTLVPILLSFLYERI